MKTIYMLSVLTFMSALLALSAACDSSAVSGNGSQFQPIDAVDSMKYLDTVHLTTAQVAIQRYVNLCDSLMLHTPIRAYRINLPDVVNAFGVRDTTINVTNNECRVYLGLNEDGHFKLYMTPVDINGKDSICWHLDKQKNVVKYVYDLNAPCPSTCDTGSPLYMKHQ